MYVADPFVKVYLLINGKRVKKKKTAPRKGSCNPVWNEALIFSLSASNLPNAAIEVYSITNNHLTKRQLIYLFKNLCRCV